MQLALLDGGPWTGFIPIQPMNGVPVFTISIVHSFCGCDHCKRVGKTHVEHVYERNDQDIFMYRDSVPAEQFNPFSPFGFQT